MCITAFVIRAGGRFRFVLIGNRDEFQKRQTDPLREEVEKQILCARDCQAGGAQTMYNFRDGVLATLTNVRKQPSNLSNTPPRSRGLLVEDAAMSRPIDTATLPDYAGFNLLQCNIRANTVDYYTNCKEWEGERRLRVPAGAHCVSNSFLDDASWPKVVHLRGAVDAAATAAEEGRLSTTEFMDHLAALLCETDVGASADAVVPPNMRDADNPYAQAEADLQRGVWVAAQLPHDIFRTLAQTVVVAEHRDEDPDHPTLHYWYRRTHSPTEHDEWVKHSYVL